MNIAEKLRNAPKGTKLYSPIVGECELECVYLDTYYPIKTTTKQGTYTFTSEGLIYKDEPNGECMLFPSRDNRDWNNFYICPFKKGDFIVREYLDGDKFIAIFSHFGGFCKYSTNYLCLLRPGGEFKPRADFGIGDVQEARLATDSEKKELLDAIKRNGYTWNSDTLTLEEIRKFDIDTLKPFDKVLVRNRDGDFWNINLFSHYNKMYKVYTTVRGAWEQCIPYNEETKHLVGTTNDCPEYYKTW